MVFKNDIYTGPPKGFFSYESLDKFVKGLPNVTESIYDQKHETRLFAHKVSGIPIFALYHFDTDGDKVVECLSVYSITKTKGLSEIETLIIDEAKSRKEL